MIAEVRSPMPVKSQGPSVGELIGAGVVTAAGSAVVAGSSVVAAEGVSAPPPVVVVADGVPVGPMELVAAPPLITSSVEPPQPAVINRLATSAAPYHAVRPRAARLRTAGV